MEAPERGRPWRPLVVVGLSGEFGGLFAVVLPVATLPDHTAVIDVGPFRSSSGPRRWRGACSGGWFVAILALARTHGGVRCPRCGTENPRGFSTRRACELRAA
jgi:hypothetical protein